MIIDSTEQIISTVVDSLIYKEPAPLVDTLTSNYTPFVSHYVQPDRVVSSLTDLFGPQAVIHRGVSCEPLLTATDNCFLYPLVEYLFVFIVLLFTSLVLYKFSEYVGRLFKLAFSFPHLHRQLESANNVIDTMSHYVSSIAFSVVPIIYVSFDRCYPTPFLKNVGVLQIWIGIALVVGLYLYSVMVKYLFYRFFHNRYFYRRLFIAERICISSYVLILLPLSLLASVPNFFQNTLIKVQFLMIIMFCIHYLLTVFKLFIEEKVSYIQLILYFCTVKAVIIGLIIYFGILWL